MNGSVDVEAPPVEMAQDRMPIFTCWYDEKATDPDKAYSLIPRLQCVKVEYKEGHEPPTAQFAYVQDDSDPAQDEQIPTQFEDYWPGSTKDLEYRLLPDDRVVVLAIVDWEDKEDPTTGEVTSKPITRVLFDGVPRMPQTDVDSSSQSVAVLAVGVAIRCWDQPVKESLFRDTDQPTAGEAITTDLPTRFNPDGKPNCTVKAGWYSPEVAGTTDRFGDSDFPIFLDPNFTRNKDQIEFWTLDKAVMYLLATQNDRKYVESPDFDILESLLRNRKPVDGSDFYDPSDPSTYEENPIVLRDVDVTGEPWPEAVSRLLGYGGFGMRFVCEDDEDGKPWNHLEVYRKDNDGPNDPKEINFPRAASLDQETVDIQNLHVAHDYHSVFNSIVIETKPLRYEVGVVLAPAFEPSPSDSMGSNRDRFKKGNLDDHPEYRNDYRLYVGDECGDGHWDMTEGDWSVDPLDLSAIFPDDPDDGSRTYVRRYRPGSIDIFTKDANGKAIKTQLALSRDYAGPKPPCLWDGTGTWQVIHGGFEVLKDRLGIWVSVNDPAQWDIGEPSDPANAQEPTRILDGLTSQANMNDEVYQAVAVQRVRPFYLRLVTTIEGDHDIRVYSGRRASSPIKHEVWRVIDCRDHFTRKAVLKSSPFNSSGETTYTLDQQEQAQAHADQLRAVHEYPPVAGAIVVPQVTFAYQVGDRISKINGREVSFRSNAGEEQGDAPAYPFVVAMHWQFTPDRQSTTLQISDRRAEPQRVTGKSRA